MFDQPTQAFTHLKSIPRTSPDVAVGNLSDDDRRSVEAMFALMHPFVTELAPEL